MSRAALFGTTAAVPNLMVLLLQRSAIILNSIYLVKIVLVRLYQIDFPFQNKTFPEELSAGRSSPSHKCCVCFRLDDPGLIQSLSTTGNDKEGKR